MLAITPIDFDEACEFIRKYHRHHKPPRGWKFGAACSQDDQIVGVVMVGRPVSRVLDNGWTLEVTRLCTDDTPHVASMLYATAWRATKALGYKRLITYILEEEKGTSLIAAGWRLVGAAGGGSWSCKSRPRIDLHPLQPKMLWEKNRDGE